MKIKIAYNGFESCMHESSQLEVICSEKTEICEVTDIQLLMQNVVKEWRLIEGIVSSKEKLVENCRKVRKRSKNETGMSPFLWKFPLESWRFCRNSNELFKVPSFHQVIRHTTLSFPRLGPRNSRLSAKRTRENRNCHQYGRTNRIK